MESAFIGLVLGTRYSPGEDCTRAIVPEEGDHWPRLVVWPGRIEVLAWGSGP